MPCVTINLNPDPRLNQNQEFQIEHLPTLCARLPHWSELHGRIVDAADAPHMQGHCFDVLDKKIGSELDVAAWLGAKWLHSYYKSEMQYNEQSKTIKHTMHCKSLHATPRSRPMPLALLIADIFSIIFVIFIVLRPWHVVLVVRLDVVLARLA